MAKMLSREFVEKYAQSIVALIIALIVLFWTLNFLHTRFGGNILGRGAGMVGARASGSMYQFQG